MSASGQKRMYAVQQHVRFTPESDRESRHRQTVMSALPPPKSRHVQCTNAGLLWAKSGQVQTA